jgi:hypothetical protein
MNDIDFKEQVNGLVAFFCLLIFMLVCCAILKLAWYIYKPDPQVARVFSGTNRCELTQR